MAHIYAGKPLPKAFNVYIAKRYLDLAEAMFNRVEAGELSQFIFESIEMRLDQEGQLPYEATLRRIIREELANLVVAPRSIGPVEPVEPNQFDLDDILGKVNFGQ